MIIDLDEKTIPILITGLFYGSHDVDPRAIPSTTFIDIAKALPLENWDYSKISLEEWVSEQLLIVPYVWISEDELKEMKEYPLYFEKENGNAPLIVCAKVIG